MKAHASEVLGGVDQELEADVSSGEWHIYLGQLL
jgi:hypothetical protein